MLKRDMQGRAGVGRGSRKLGTHALDVEGSEEGGTIGVYRGLEWVWDGQGAR